MALTPLLFCQHWANQWRNFVINEHFRKYFVKDLKSFCDKVSALLFCVAIGIYIVKIIKN